ncbi:MAG: hypothetical protein E4H15_07095, partial [Syntrophobacterales bacterium]
MNRGQKTLLSMLALLIILVPSSGAFRNDDAPALFDIPCWVLVRTVDQGSAEDVREELADMGLELGDGFTLVPYVSAFLGELGHYQEVMGLAGVVDIRPQSIIQPAVDISSKASKAVPSTVYSPYTAHELGATGKG